MENGVKFSHYTIEKKIGEGGMGEVYLAFDNSLERFVALKILSNEFSKDTERVLRLKQEAKAASSLNHPNIITIYEIGKSENIEFIAMEYVEGKTLREIIESNELSILDAVQIAEQIADGLCVAHNAHIAHRDIKPENIIIRPDGYIRILDFGLAKPTVFPKTTNEDETIELIKTAPGVVMGSVRYMSPEQARGKNSDERSDIWSLGIVLYEMISGKSPFDGETISDTLANLIHLTPQPLTEIVPNIPDELDQIISKTLQKNISERYQTAKEFASDLKNLRREIESDPSAKLIRPKYAVDSSAKQLSGETKTRIYQSNEAKFKPTEAELAQTQIISQPNIKNDKIPKPNYIYILAGIIGVLLIGSLIFFSTKFFSENKTAVANFQNPQISKMSDDGKSRLPAISPDGKYIAFQSGELGARNIMVRQLATGSAVEIAPKSGLSVSAISFSPDGNYVYYVQANSEKSINSLYQVPTLGGASKKIIDDIDSRITFNPDGKKIAFIRYSEKSKDTLYVANVDGTDEKPLISSAETDYGFFTEPAWSPTNDKILIRVGKVAGGETVSVSLAEVSPEGKLSSLANSSWISITDIYWKKNGDGFFALASEKPNEPKQVWNISYPDGERKRITNDTNSYIWLGVSGDDKTLITVKSDSSSSLWSFSPTAKALNQITIEDKNLIGDSGMISLPNGNLIVSRYKDSELNLWEITTAGKEVRQLTANANFNADPKISPDGTKICFMSNRSKLWRVWTMDIDGKNPRQLTNVADEVNQFYPNFVNDGKTIFYAQQQENSANSKLMRVSSEGGIPERVFPDSVENENGLTVSPDGKKLIMITTDKDYKKFLQIYPIEGDKLGNLENKFEVGLMESMKWSADGKSITYLSNEGTPNLWQTSLDGKDKKQITNFTAGRIFNFTWAKDGKQIFITRGTVNNELILIKDL